MTLYQGNQENWQITVMIWAPMQKTANAVKTRDPDRVFTHAGAFSGCVDKILKSLLRHFQLTLKASKIRKNFQFHTVPMKDMTGHRLPAITWPRGKELHEFRSQKRIASRANIRFRLALR